MRVKNCLYFDVELFLDQMTKVLKIANKKVIYFMVYRLVFNRTLSIYYFF